MIDTSKNKVYWFLDHHFGRRWNDFKGFIGHTSDPKWLTWLIDHIPSYYPKKEMEELNREMGYYDDEV